jgi:ABC-type Fe3+-hydroxamate transport system substrate-binding protein
MTPRIVSLVPSLTELLSDLELDEEVVGITKFCVHPDHWFRNKTRVGGTKAVDPDVVRGLTPSLIIANKEENLREQVEPLRSFSEVHVSDVVNLPGALDMIRTIGGLVDRSSRAGVLTSEIEDEFADLKPGAPLPVAYLVWRNPWMAAGGDTFINDMLSRAGFVNVFAKASRYPTVDAAALAASGARVVLLSSEPFPFKAAHKAEIHHALPGAEVHLVDGEMFSWYGSRLRYAPAYFAALRNSLP